MNTLYSLQSTVYFYNILPRNITKIKLSVKLKITDNFRLLCDHNIYLHDNANDIKIRTTCK